MSSSLNFFPIEIGKAKLELVGNSWKLSVNGEQWFVYNKENKTSATEFWLETDLAFGKVITTGLGLGVIQELLINKKSVSEVVVYEKNKDVINIFNELLSHNNLANQHKLKIIEGNAEELTNEECDCLFLDHYELESFNYIIDSVRNISKNNSSSVTWFWPGGGVYRYWVHLVNTTPGAQSFEEFKRIINIRGIPSLYSYQAARLYATWKHLKLPK